jgi:hypothetical protein
MPMLELFHKSSASSRRRRYRLQAIGLNSPTRPEGQAFARRGENFYNEKEEKKGEEAYTSRIE